MITFIVWLLALGLGLPGIIRWIFNALNPEKTVRLATITLPLVGLVLSIITAGVISSSFGQIQAGHRGVLLRFGAVTGQIKSEGLYFVTPGVESVVEMDVQVHADKTKATAASHDLQNVATEVTVNYRLDPNQVANIYRDLRDQYVARVLQPAIQEAVKSATAQFNAENLVIERPQVKDMIEQFLQKRLAQHGIIVDGIAITDFQFSSDFASAIEAKVTSLQLALKAKNDLEIVRNQQLVKYETAKADSFATVTNAKAEAEAIKIKTQAINAQGGKEYVNLQAIEKWDGALPQWMNGGNGSSVPFINLTPPLRKE